MILCTPSVPRSTGIETAESEAEEEEEEEEEGLQQVVRTTDVFFCKRFG